jgi:hypothetical protein
MNLIDLFVKDIEDIYKKISIYRCIIIVKDINEGNELIKKLKKYDYDPIYLTSPIINKNYRLFIISLNNIKILRDIDKNDYNCLLYNYYTIK